MKTSKDHSTNFCSFAKHSARFAGQPITFAFALGIVILWAITGPIFHFSDTWQLVINTGTSVLTFLMVFLIQNTQDRDSQAIQIKLDELIRTSQAHNLLLNLEDLSQEDLDVIRKRYEKLAQKARQDVRRGKTDTGCPDVSSLLSEKPTKN